MSSSLLQTWRVVRAVVRHPSNRGRRLRRTLAAVGFQLFKRTLGRPLVVDLENGCRFLAYPDCHLSSMAVYFRQPYAPLPELLRVRPGGGTLIDVGANVGLFALSLADHFDRAYLFEPNPAAVRRARENMALNDLDFELFAVALSDRDGTLHFEDRGGVDTTNRVLRPGERSSTPTIEVPCRTLDDFLADLDPPRGEISLLKIDVEGHEEAVFGGMLETLANRRPAMVMFEYLERSNLEAITELLTSVGYRLHQLDDAGRLHPAEERPRPHQDLFALPA